MSNNTETTETTEMKYRPLPGLGRLLSRELSKVVLDVHVTNYLSGTLTAEDTRAVKKAFVEYLRTEADENKNEKALASDVLKAEEAYHVTLMFPSERNEPLLRRAADLVGVDVPSDYAELSKKKRSHVHGEVMRALKALSPRVEVTFGDSAFVTTDGELAAIEVRLLSPSAPSAPSVYEVIDPEKIFHVTLIHNRDVEERAPSFSNTFMQRMRSNQ
jgi:hypothetical protein